MADPAIPEPVIPDPAPPVSKATLFGVAIFVAALVTLLFLVPNAEPKIAPDVTDPAKIYAENCAVCHGPRGEGKGPFPKIIGTKKSEEEIQMLFEHGKNQMPRFGGTPEQREALIKWVKALK